MPWSVFIQGTMPRIKLALFAVLAISQNSFAVEIPSAGSQIQQIPQAPLQQKPDPRLRIEQGNAPAVAESDNTRIAVNAIRISGATVYSEASLIDASGFRAGEELSLSELRALTTAITDLYHRDGYILAQAYLPAQDIDNGVVNIAVMEGTLGKIEVRNQSRLANHVVQSRLDGIQAGQIVSIEPLESGLLLLSDIPGVNVTSTLAPGAAVGTSDLIVDVTPGRAITGSIDADNGGNRYTGEYRGGATVNFNNLLGLGDVASVRGLTSGSGLNYGRLAYQLPVGKATVGVAYSRLSYELGKEFRSLDVHGTAEIASVYGSYPLLRSRSTNLYAQLAYDHKILDDRIGSASDDKTVDVVTASLLGDHRDNFFGGGLSAFTLSGSTGRLDLQTPETRQWDAATAQSHGSFNKLGFSLMRLQSVTSSVSIYGSLRGQLASKNLDISETFGIGGMDGIRAYPEGEAYGDEGYLATLEARWRLPQFSPAQTGQLELIGFVETATITSNRNRWTTGDNRRNLSGTGVGVNWYDYDNFAVKLAYARKLGSADATSAPDKDGRFWVQLVKYF
jgi:hemolysin activation/secretion protein